MSPTEEKFINIVTKQLKTDQYDEPYDFHTLFVTLGPYAIKRIFAGTWRLAFIHQFADLCDKYPGLEQYHIVTMFPNSWDGVVLYHHTIICKTK